MKERRFSSKSLWVEFRKINFLFLEKTINFKQGTMWVTASFLLVYALMNHGSKYKTWYDIICNTINGDPIKINRLMDSHVRNVWRLGLWFKFSMMFGDSCNESPKREKVVINHMMRAKKHKFSVSRKKLCYSATTEIFLGMYLFLCKILGIAYFA